MASGRLEDKLLLTGLTKHTSADQKTCIIEDAFLEKKNTVVVWVDVEQAFNNVWRMNLTL